MRMRLPAAVTATDGYPPNRTCAFISVNSRICSFAASSSFANLTDQPTRVRAAVTALLLLHYPNARGASCPIAARQTAAPPAVFRPLLLEAVKLCRLLVDLRLRARHLEGHSGQSRVALERAKRAAPLAACALPPPLEASR